MVFFQMYDTFMYTLLAVSIVIAGLTRHIWFHILRLWASWAHYRQFEWNKSTYKLFTLTLFSMYLLCRS